ncbi:MAG: hypothetical protein Q4A54_08700 [Parabacteroides sp.]|nr:hypothetical protein [Parabacteroides sp.]
MSEFSVGDRVRIKTWEELLQECTFDESFYVEEDDFGKHIFSYKHIPGFIAQMGYLCGKTATVIDVKEGFYSGMDRIYLELDSAVKPVSEIFVPEEWEYANYMMVLDDSDSCGDSEDFPNVIDFYN